MLIQPSFDRNPELLAGWNTRAITTLWSLKNLLRDAAESCLGMNPVLPLGPGDTVLWWTACEWWTEPRGGDTASVCSDHSRSVQAPRGAFGAPRAPQQISQLYSPTLTRNMPHDPYQAACKVNIHPTIYYHKLCQRIRPWWWLQLNGLSIKTLAVCMFICVCVCAGKELKSHGPCQYLFKLPRMRSRGPGEICMNTSCEWCHSLSGVSHSAMNWNRKQ